MEFVAGFYILCCKFINLDKTAVFYARQVILKHFLKKTSYKILLFNIVFFNQLSKLPLIW